jgi:hypothetical protein
MAEIVMKGTYIFKNMLQENKWELNATLSPQENTWLSRMQIVLNSKSQNKENQMTHCVAEAIPLLPETTLVW